MFFSNLKRVLTAEFCSGCKINNVEGIKRQGLSLKDVSWCTLDKGTILIVEFYHWNAGWNISTDYFSFRPQINWFEHSLSKFSTLVSFMLTLTLEMVGTWVCVCVYARAKVWKRISLISHKRVFSISLCWLSVGYPSGLWLNSIQRRQSQTSQ